MSDEKALCAAIWASPHDDTLRLAYADWLDEHDRPERAEFIRLQCELAQLVYGEPAPAEMKAREAELWARHRAAWTAGLPRRVKARPFRRGFPAPELNPISGPKFVALSAAVLDPAPLWAMRLLPTPKSLTAIAASPNLLRVGRLDLGHVQNSPKVAAFLGSPNLHNVSELFLGSSGVARNAVPALLANDALTNLAELDLEDTRLTDDLLAGLVAAPRVARLRWLDLSSNSFGDPGLLALARSPHMTRLAGLVLAESLFRRWNRDQRGPRFGTPALREFCTSPILTGLRSLDLGNTELGDDAVRVFLETEHSFRLVALSLFGCGLSARSAEVLARWRGLGHVGTLRLAENPLGDGGAAVLARARGPFRLTRLDLSRCEIGDAGAVALANWPGLAGLRALDFGGNPFGPAGAEALARSEHLNGVRALRLYPHRASKAVVKPLLTRFGDRLIHDSDSWTRNMSDD